MSDPEKAIGRHEPSQEESNPRYSREGSIQEKSTLHRTATSSSSSSNKNSTTSHSPTRTPRSASLARSGLSRTVSEVRDGILNQRELGDGGDEEAGSGDAAGREKGPGTQEDSETARDENLVDWEGPADPLNPKNWPRNKKWAAVITGSLTIPPPHTHPAPTTSLFTLPINSS